MNPQLTTDAQIRAIKTPLTNRQDWSIAGVPGLRLRVTPAGTKTFRLESRKTGKVTLGTFPGLSLKEARQAAQALLSDAERSKVNRVAASPVLARKTRTTLAAVMDAYEAEKGRNLTSWPEARRAIEFRYGDRLSLPADTMTSDVILAPVRRDRIVAAKRTAVYLCSVLRWAELGDPVRTARLDELVPEQARTRVLNRAEIRAVLKTTMLGPTWTDYTRSLFLSMQRRSDVAKMLVKDVDLEAGTWSATIHKNRGGAVRIALPVSRQWSELLERRSGGTYFFETRNGRPLTTSFDKQLKRLQAACGVHDWSWHDIRRTSRTLMSELRVPPSVAERCMVHSQPDGRIAAIYDQHDWLPQMREAFDALACKIEEIERVDPT